jgi:hypothetical protein
LLDGALVAYIAEFNESSECLLDLANVPGAAKASSYRHMAVGIRQGLRDGQSNASTRASNDGYPSAELI